MRTYFFEVTNGFNWGKFAVSIFDDEEWSRPSNLTGCNGCGHPDCGTYCCIHNDACLETRSPLLSKLGWARHDLHLWVLDLQTGEGAYFRPGGSARYDLNSKHQIWVCPLYEPFLVWLYKQCNEWTRLEAPELLLAKLSQGIVHLTEEEAPSSLYGHRRRRI